MDDGPKTVAGAILRHGSWINAVKSKDVALGVKLATVVHEFGEDTSQGYDEALWEIVTCAYMMGLSYHQENHALIVRDLSEMVNRVAAQYQKKGK